MSGIEDDDLDLEEEASRGDIASKPSEVADPQWIVDAKIPKDIRERYEVFSYRGAAAILSEIRKEEFADVLKALRSFSLTKRMIRTAGGNESEIPKLFSNILRPKGWNETLVQGDLRLKLVSKRQSGVTKAGKVKYQKHEEERIRPKFLDGHKIDYVKGRVAFDLEWNSKDQTFDRDLYAFNAFAICGVVDVAVLVTRGESLNEVIRGLGPALSKNGDVEKDRNGNPRSTRAKYGASTTWMGKLIYRLNAGRNGGCPVLAVGIGPQCVQDWKKK
ncbi:MAG: restriction endonuclease [Alphaproteobacteria bacterium]|nr:restriction endonuclease [Alphaproteobacteria bacterium]